MDRYSPNSVFSSGRRVGAPRLWAVIPVKDFVHAKQRLSGVLSPSERRALSQAMVEDLLTQLQSVALLEGILLVSDDPAAELLAFRYGAKVLLERGHSRGLNVAVTRAAAHLQDRGATHMLVLHGDLPCLAVADICTMGSQLSEPGRPALRLAPDRCGAGTNGLLCSLPAPIPFGYGRGSLHWHRQAGRQRGIPCRVLALPSFGLDIDTPRDLQFLLEILGAGSAAGMKTAAVLEEYQVAVRLRQMAIAGTLAQGKYHPRQNA